MKVIKSVCLDSELVAEAKLRKINVSALFNEFLARRLEMVKQEAEGSSLDEQVISLKAMLATKEVELEREKEKKARGFGVKKEVMIHVP